MGKKWDIDKFIEKSKEIHKNIETGNPKYSYENTIYEGYDNNLTMTCPVHGDFEQTPHNHLNKRSPHGCQKCGKEKSVKSRTKDRKEFIKEAIEIHGNKYNYDNVIYETNKINVLINCLTCWEQFSQSPSSHLDGHGCSNCARCKKMTQKKFIEKSEEKHNHSSIKYLYDKVIFRDRLKEVMIFCKECNAYFLQTPKSHMKGSGCQICANNILKTNDEFIKQSEKVHTKNGECLYGYEQCEYTGNKNYVKIRCIKENIIFEQQASSHLAGHGCSSCNKGKSEKMVREIVEEITGLKCPSVKPKFLKNKKTGYNLEIDCYNEKYNFGIEYDGLQHSQYVPYFHRNGIKDFEDQQKRDKFKDEKCKDNGTILIRVPYVYSFKNKEKMFEFIDDQLLQRGILGKIGEELKTLYIYK